MAEERDWAEISVTLRYTYLSGFYALDVLGFFNDEWNVEGKCEGWKADMSAGSSTLACDTDAY